MSRAAARPSAIDSPVPIDVLGQENLRRSAAIPGELGEVLDTLLPSAYMARDSNNDLADVVRTVQLRGLEKVLLALFLSTADAQTLLIHVRAGSLKLPPEKMAGVPEGTHVAYSKICTHAGCPASLYEQQTNRLLCPCHQSQFIITDNARPIFGPASRRLPQLPIEVDAEGFFVAASDYKETVGPDFWERP